VVWKKDRAWGNSRYIAVTDDGRTLKTLFDDLHILPGKYHFYFLGRGGWILSAEKLSGDIRDLLPALEEAFDFTPDELEANRRGELTDRQARRLRSEMTSGLIKDLLDVFAKFGIIGLGILGVIALFFNLRFLTWALVSLLYLAIIMGLKARRSRASYRPLLADLADKHVESAEGVKQDSRDVDIQDEQTGKRKTVTFNYLIVTKINQRFSIGRKGRSALVRTGGIDYRVYYTPHSRSLASLEPIQGTQAKDAGSTEQ